MSQIAADVFRIAPGDVVFRAGDTALVPYGMGTFASRSVVTAGAAIRLAAGKLRDRVRRVAAELVEASVDDLEVAGGQVRVRGVAARSVSLRDVYRAAAPGPGARLPDGMEPGSAESHYFVPPTVTWGCGLVAADVDVDPETGVVEVRRLAIVHDCGRVVNPVIVEGQIQGGLVQGMGAALYEHMPYDESGQPLASTFMDYLLPTSAEAPEIVQVHLEHPSDRNPLGVKGVGEAGTIAPPAAFANAVADALAEPAVELNELPPSPARVLAAIEARRSR